MCVEVRVEDADLRDPVDRELVPRGRLADRFRGGCLVDTKGLAAVVAHVRLEPGHALIRVALDDGETRLHALDSAGNGESVLERALHDIPRQILLLLPVRD